MRQFSRLIPAVALAASLAGCQAPATTAAPDGDRAIRVQLVPPAARQVQALLRRYREAELDHYIVRLFVADDNGVFQGAGAGQTMWPADGLTLNFMHLKPKRYQVRLEGYNRANERVTERTTQDIDLTVNDVPAVGVHFLEVHMRDTVFAGTVVLPTAGLGWATSLHAVLKKGGETVSAITYAPGQAAKFKNIPVGHYVLELTGTDALDAEAEATAAVDFDPAALELEDVATPAVDLEAP